MDGALKSTSNYKYKIRTVPNNVKTQRASLPDRD